MVEVNPFLIIAVVVVVVIFFSLSLLICLFQRYCRKPVHRRSVIHEQTTTSFEPNKNNIELSQNIVVEIESSQEPQRDSNKKKLSLTNAFLLPYEFGRRNSQHSVTSSRSGSIEVKSDVSSPALSHKKAVRFENVRQYRYGEYGPQPRKMSFSYRVYNDYSSSQKIPLKPILKSPKMHMFRSHDGFDSKGHIGLRVCRISTKATETIV